MSGENTASDIGCGTGSGISEIGRPDMGLASDASVDTLAPADGRRGLPGRPVPHGCLCSMVLRPVERLVFSPKER